MQEIPITVVQKVTKVSKKDQQQPQPWGGRESDSLVATEQRKCNSIWVLAVTPVILATHNQEDPALMERNQCAITPAPEGTVKYHVSWSSGDLKLGYR